MYAAWKVASFSQCCLMKMVGNFPIEYISSLALPISMMLRQNQKPHLCTGYHWIKSHHTRRLPVWVGLGLFISDSKNLRLPWYCSVRGEGYIELAQGLSPRKPFMPCAEKIFAPALVIFEEWFPFFKEGYCNLIEKIFSDTRLLGLNVSRPRYIKTTCREVDFI